jgi:hypothetical protein
VNAEYKESNKIEKGGPHDRVTWPQHSGRNEGRNRVGGIVKPVEEVKRQRDDNQANQGRQTEARNRLATSKLIDHERADLVRNIFKAVSDFFKVVV